MALPVATFPGGTSEDHSRALGEGLLKGPMEGRSLVSEVPLY
jgi:hypothetical protein